jgi:hypothetical protein
MKWFLSVVAVVSLFAGMAAAVYGFPWIMCVGAVACGGFLIAANLDRISHFKATRNGVEAQTREVIERAESAVREVQLLAAHVAQLSLSLIKRTGRWGGYTDDEQDAQRKAIIDVLQKLDVPNGSIEAALIDWHRIVGFDYAHLILGGSRIPENAPEVMDEWSALRSGGIASYPTPEVLRAFLFKHGFMTPEIEEYVRDYEHYIAHRVHRRPDVWRRRESWGHLKRA